MSDGTVRLPDLWADAELATLVRAAAAWRGVSYAEFARTALKLLIWFDTEVAQAGIQRDAVRWCVVCGSPRREDPVDDAMAHAQCHTILANIEKELAHA